MAVFLFGDPVPPPRAWPLGLSKNPAAPAPVVLRLLDHEAGKYASHIVDRKLPEELADVLMTHPAPQVRSAFARSYRATVEQRLRFADDPSTEVRRARA